MMKFAAISRTSQVETPSVPASALTVLMMAAFMLALAAYCVPWMVGRGAGLSLTGYDLAEWTGLIPDVRYGGQPMLIPALLRVQLLILAMIAVLIPARRFTGGWWAGLGVSLLLIVAQLPPFEYFLHESWRSDVNYGQQMTLVVLGIINVVACVVVPRRRPRLIALMLISAVGIVSALTGASQALTAAARHDVMLVPGVGVWGYCAALLGLAAFSVISWRRR